MRVLVNAGPWLEVPPGGYGGIENVIATLVPELRALGARVVLATIRTSTLEADDYIWTLDEPHLSEVAQPYNRTVGVAMAHMHAVSAALRDRGASADGRAARSGGAHRLGPIDVVHDHLEVVGPAMFGAMGAQCPPVLQTLHWDLAKHGDFYRSFDGGARVGFAAVSRAQLDHAPANLRRQTLGVVPLGVPAPTPPPAPPSTPDSVPRSPGPVVVLARITRDKGQDIAIRACRRAGVPLVLAGPVAGIGDRDELECRLRDRSDPLHEHPDVAYYRAEVAPHLEDPTVRWVGSVAGEEKERLLAGARALLAPVRWCEPGATAVVEALTRGVPVVATALGAHTTLVDHGVTGFLADDEIALAQHLGELDSIDRDACRRAASRWTPREMACAYLRLYERLIARSRR